MDDAERPGRERAALLLTQLPLLAALVALWMLLWGTLSWLSLLTGVVVAVVVMRVFYLPAVELTGRLNVLWLAVFAVRFLGELVGASFLVAAQAFGRRDGPANAVLAVELRSASDFMTTATALALSLIPGTTVVEVDRYRSILYVHALRVGDAEGVEKARAHVLRVERTLVRAIGSRDDLARIRS